MNELYEGKSESMKLLRDIVDRIDNEEVSGVLLTYMDGQLGVSLLNISELEATNMLMHAASLAHEQLGAEVVQ